MRECGAELGVNPHTVMRSYEKLTAEGIIYNKRGIGYYVSTGARDKVLESLRKEFLDNEWPAVRRRIKLLGLSPDELFE